MGDLSPSGPGFSKTFVAGTGVPPESGTRRIALTGLGENRITPWRFQVPPRPLLASHRVWGGPPAIATFLSLPPAKNPRYAPSGDQKGYVAPSVPASGLASSVSMARTHT